MQAFCNTHSDFHMEKTVPVDKYGHLEKFRQKIFLRLTYLLLERSFDVFFKSSKLLRFPLLINLSRANVERRFSVFNSSEKPTKTC